MTHSRMTLEDLKGRATITVEESADVLGIARGTAYEAARTGQLPVLTLGRRRLVPVPKLLALLGVAADPASEATAEVGPESLAAVAPPPLRALRE
jgi:excisionase family DNA binding protein